MLGLVTSKEEALTATKVLLQLQKLGEALPDFLQVPPLSAFSEAWQDGFELDVKNG